MSFDEQAKAAPFVDRVRVFVQGGDGGAGANAFRREKGVPRGGPSGGDGGQGGDVVALGDAGLSTLLDQRYRPRHRAERGRHGEGSNRSGKAGADAVLRVPLGTRFVDEETGRLLGEVLRAGQRLRLAKGGRGGRGNARFASAVRQAPRYWESGEEGESKTLMLELKLIADIGFVGEPNAGKSTLLARVSKARPKVASYPFTTLAPQLGVARLSGHRSFVAADLPGIIEGAHQGKGLGHQFLRHIERTRLLAILIPANEPDPSAAAARVRRELELYSETLGRKPWAVVYTKIDLGPASELREVGLNGQPWGRFQVSAVTGQGISGLMEACWRKLREVKEGDEDPSGR